VSSFDRLAAAFTYRTRREAGQPTPTYREPGDTEPFPPEPVPLPDDPIEAWVVRWHNRAKSAAWHANEYPVGSEHWKTHVERSAAYRSCAEELAAALRGERPKPIACYGES